MIKGIKGFTPTSLIDWPGKITAVIFLAGCSFRCHYCYNSEFILNPGSIKDISEKKIMSYLEKKKKWLDGVVMLGGEPTIHKDFLDLVKKIRKLGLKIGVHTNGTNPEVLKELIKKKQADYFAMDIKAPLEDYKKVVNIDFDAEKIKDSIDLIKNSKIDYEFRITVVPGLIGKKDIKKIGEWLKGSKRFYIQQFKNGKTLDPKYAKIKPYKIPELLEMKKIADSYFKKVEIRGI